MIKARIKLITVHVVDGNTYSRLFEPTSWLSCRLLPVLRVKNPHGQRNTCFPASRRRIALDFLTRHASLKPQLGRRSSSLPTREDEEELSLSDVGVVVDKIVLFAHSQRNGAIRIATDRTTTTVSNLFLPSRESNLEHYVTIMMNAPPPSNIMQQHDPNDDPFAALAADTDAVAPKLEAPTEFGFGLKNVKQAAEEDATEATHEAEESTHHDDEQLQETTTTTTTTETAASSTDKNEETAQKQ